MTVAELIEALQALPQDSLVVMSKDGEGNDFSPLSEVDQGSYLADSTWSGELVAPVDHDDAVRAVVLWPTN